MRCLVSYLAIFLLACPAWAQINQQVIKVSDQTGCKALASSEQHLFVNISKNSLFNELAVEQWIYKLDHKLNLIDSVLINPFINYTDSANARMHALKYSDGKLYSLFEVQNLRQNSRGCYLDHSFIVVLDTNLNVSDIFKLGTDSLRVLLLGLDIKDHILLTSGYAIPCIDSLEPYRPYLAEINLNSGTIRERQVPISTLNRFAFYLDNPKIVDRGYIASLFPHKAPEFENSILFDTIALQILKKGSVRDFQANEPRVIKGNGFFIEVNPDSILHMGTVRSYIPTPAYPRGEYWTFGLSYLDSNMNVTSIDTFTLAGYDYNTRFEIYTGPFPAWDPVAYSTIDSILFIQGEHLINYDNYASQDSTAFYIYNFNASRGVMNWVKKVQRLYTNGDHSVEALPGNLWALSFNEYNWDEFTGPNLAVHIWIIDDQGNVINQKEFSNQKEVTLNIYPNPTDDFLHLLGELPQHNSYSILNAAGQKVMSGKMHENILDVSLLDAGSYYLIMQIKGSEQIGRFFKK